MSFTIPFIISPSKTNVWSVTFHNDAASEGGIYERDCAHWDSTQELSHPLQFTALWHLFPDPFLNFSIWIKTVAFVNILKKTP